jgi:transposase InsO family protein
MLTPPPHIQAACAACSQFARPNPSEPQAILTRRRLQLVMFDLKKLPGLVDEHGHQAYLMLIVDHFTKYKWGCIMYGKDAARVAQYLFEVFSQEGTPERWHADNGSEFKNGMVEKCRVLLGLGNSHEKMLKYTHGGVRYDLVPVPVCVMYHA